MYSIEFDDLTKAVLVNALEKERKLWADKILQGDNSAAPKVMHEQLFKIMRGILYANKKEALEGASDTVDAS